MSDDLQEGEADGQQEEQEDDGEQRALVARG